MKGSMTGSTSTATILQIAFVILKLCKVIDWSWWLVLSPTWIMAGIVVILLITLFVLRRKNERLN